MRLKLSAAAFLALLPGLAQAAEPPCLNPAEFSALAGFALPSVIEGANKRCATTLAPTSYLRTSGSQLVSRYAERKDAAWPGAKSAFMKLSTSTNAQANDVLKTLPDDTLKDMLDLMLEGMVSQEIPLNDCDTIDQFVRLLAPLPAQNTAELVGLIVGLVGNGDKGTVGRISLCKK